MTNVLLVAQEKGGVGKSLIARALAEAVPGAPVIEIDSTPRLIELESRVTFFPMRAERVDIEKTGGRAARAEFDPVIDAIARATSPTIVDIGANTSRALLTELLGLAPDLAAAGVRFGLVVIVTNEDGALAEAPRLLDLGTAFAERFVLENRVHGRLDPRILARIAGSVPVSTLEEFVLEEEAQPILQGGGLSSIPKLDPAKLTAHHGMALAARIRRDLAGLRLAAMEAVRAPAEWLIGSAQPVATMEKS